MTEPATTQPTHAETAARAQRLQTLFDTLELAEELLQELPALLVKAPPDSFVGIRDHVAQQLRRLADTVAAQVQP
jgi:hypothetical protein